MEENTKIDRLLIIKRILICVFIVISLKILYMTIFKYDHYIELAENKTYKEVPIKAPRGEIRDRYGRLIAGNKNLFTVQVSADGLNKKDSKDKSKANEVCLDLIKLLENNNEEYIDEFPIYIENGKYYYTFDKKIRDYKKENNIPEGLNAKESFYFIVDRLISEGVLTKEDRNLEPAKLQKKLNENGEYPPILVSSWTFTEDKNKKDWLGSYKIKDVSAKEAFEKIRKIYEINPDLSDAQARKILIIRDAIKSQGFSRYNPVTIAKDISQNTISQIEEKGMELPGVAVALEPVRFYPDEKLGSHIIGHMGKIPYNQEEKYLKREEGKKYSKGDTVGVSGVEKSYEEQLKGIDGHKKVQVDASGRVTKELDVSEPKSGDTVYLSIDSKLQEEAQEILRKTVNVARTGGTYQSKFGNKSFSKGSPHANSGAVVAIDVKTGDVLAMASYPDYDPNKFVNGISYEDYKDLQPKNQNDVLAPNAQVNLATQGVFQPGSIFKMVTGMAAIDNGLNPNYTISDPGVIRLGERNFADYVWHKFRSNHGSTNLYKAIQESCNIYFYTIGSGKNWTGGSDPNVKIGPNDTLKYAKLFGLDEYTGLNEEIDERKGSVPSIEAKTESAKALLRAYLEKNLNGKFTDITKEKDEEEYEKRVNEIVNWADEPKQVTRGEAIERLAKLNVKEKDIEPLADQIVFNHLNFVKWSTADTFNLSIGQGENQYTPAQMARYTAAIANGGDLVDLSVIDRIVPSDYSYVDIDENDKKKIPFKDSEKLKHLTEGMKRVTTQGSVKDLFSNFPVEVATKTGTAEKSGKIPTENEVEYLKRHIVSYGVSLDEAMILSDKMKQDREQELSEERTKELKEELKSKDITEEKAKQIETELKEGVKVKLDKNNDKINAAYLRKAIKQLNPKITDKDIDSYKEDYGAFAWSVGFAPADNPEIAVVCMIPQGDSSTFAMLPVRDIIGTYLNLENKKSLEKKDGKDEVDNKTNDDNINFASQMKK